MADKRVLYWSSGSVGAWKVMIALEAKNLPYLSKKLNFHKKEHKSPEVMALNPRGQVPTFKDGDSYVNESGAVLLYLESQYPDPPLLPSDQVQKARVLQRLFEVDATWGNVAPYFMPRALGVENPQEEQHIEDVKAEFVLWDQYLTQHKYAATDEFTIADAALVPFLLVMAGMGMTCADYHNIKNYIERVKEHPFVAKTIHHHPPIEGLPRFMNIF